jgi:hypothetical protein
MTTPIDTMILKSVKCVKCGAGYGKCDCWTKCFCGWSFEKGTSCDNPIHEKNKSTIRKVTHNPMTGQKINSLISELKEWDDIDITFLDAHAIGGRAWVTFEEYQDWSKNEEIYVHVCGKFIERTPRFIKIVMGFGACLKSAKTDNVINPFAIPVGVILDIYRLRR